MSSGEKALKLMLETHFSGSEVLNEEDISERSSLGLLVQRTKDWALAGQVVSYDKAKWEIFNFNVCKSPGEDGSLTRGPRIHHWSGDENI
jgi:hypothetical protein